VYNVYVKDAVTTGAMQQLTAAIVSK